jgi:hypothetical protein
MLRDTIKIVTKLAKVKLEDEYIHLLLKKYEAQDTVTSSQGLSSAEKETEKFRFDNLIISISDVDAFKNVITNNQNIFPEILIEETGECLQDYKSKNNDGKIVVFKVMEGLYVALAELTTTQLAFVADLPMVSRIENSIEVKAVS